MLKVISCSGLQGRFRNITPSLRQGTQSSTPLLRVLSQLRGVNRWSPNSCGRAFFCSDSSDISDPVVGAEGKAAEAAADEAESKASSAIVPTSPRPEDCLTVRFSLFSMSRLRLVSEKTAARKKRLKEKGRERKFNVPKARWRTIKI